MHDLALQDCTCVGINPTQSNLELSAFVLRTKEEKTHMPNGERAATSPQPIFES